MGDYTRTLAQELTRQGVSCQLIAWHDAYVSEPSLSHIAGPAPLEIHRIPAGLPFEARWNLLRHTVDSFAPDWISLQFVCFSFHPRGFVTDFALRFKSITAGRPLHLMIHELWMQGGPWRYQLLGWWQRRHILRLLRVLSPNSIHANTQFYVNQLAREGWSAERLSLAGAIPIQVSTTPRRETNTWNFGLFGTLHPECRPEPLLARIHEAAQNAGQKVAIHAFGHQSAQGEKIWAQWQARHSHHLEFHSLGSRPAPEISQLLQQMDFGLATTPAALLGKSSAVAAMLDHGLPVLVMRNDWPPYTLLDHFGARQTLIEIFDPNRPLSLVELKSRRLPPEANAPAIATQLLDVIASKNAAGG